MILTHQFSRAKELGATHCFDSKNDTVEAIDLTWRCGFCYRFSRSYCCNGHSHQIIRYGGSVVTAGLSPINTKFNFNHSDLVAQEKLIRSYMGSCVPVRDVPDFKSISWVDYQLIN